MFERFLNPALIREVIGADNLTKIMATVDKIDRAAESICMIEQRLTRIEIAIKTIEDRDKLNNG